MAQADAAVGPAPAAATPVTVPWGCWAQDVDLALPFPDAFRVDINAMSGAPPCSPADLSRAVSSPIDARPLRELASGARSAVVAVDDITRPTPLAPVLSLILGELAALPAVNIRILVALGAQRPRDRAELEQKLGSGVLDAFDVEQHHPYENLAHFGTSTRGTPIWLNRTFCDAEVKVSVGSVMPHPYMGFSGGAKIIVPGVAGIETLQANHQPAVTGISGGLNDPDVDARREVEEIALKAGLAFSCNAVVNERREIAGLFCGHPVSAHRAAAGFARSVYATRAPGAPYDVVCLNAYPKDGELLQVGNAFSCFRSAKRPLVKADGTVIVTASCHHGRGHHSLHGRSMRLYKAPAPKSYLGGREVLFFSPNLNERDVTVSFSDDCRFFRSWSALTAYLESKYRTPATVGVFPTSPLQIVD